jgi:UDP-glucose 4-epimerase
MLLGNSIKKVFVTGGAGFIGSHVVDKLVSQGYFVSVYDDLSNGRIDFINHHFNKSNFKFYEESILDTDSLNDLIKEHDLVWHLAANTDIIGGYDKPRRDLMDCVVGTFNVLEAMRLNKIKPIIFSSTGATYGDLCKNDAMDEGAGPMLPVSNYAAGKIGSEAFISSYCNLYNLRAWIFRFGNVIGGRMTHGVIVDFIKRLRDNPEKLLIYGNGQQEKNYFLVEECIEGMAYAFNNIKMSKTKPCDIFNLGTGTISRVMDIAKIVREEMNLPETIFEIEGKDQAWPGDQPKVHISVEKIRKYGWSAKLASDEAVRIAVKRMLE